MTTFTEEYLKTINEEIEQEVSYITQDVVEDYSLHVGRIQALKSCRDNYLRLVKSFQTN